MLRPLRIAVSVVSGLCCVLVIVLWVRSAVFDPMMRKHGTQVQYFTSHGRVITAWSKLGAIHICVSDPQASGEYDVVFSAARAFGFGAIITATERSVRIPYWFLVALTATVGIAASRLPWRFSLRTLLLATTAAAVLLGMCAYATRG